jgi:hypothetical protein
MSDRDERIDQLADDYSARELAEYLIDAEDQIETLRSNTGDHAVSLLREAAVLLTDDYSIVNKRVADVAVALENLADEFQKGLTA